MKTRLVVAVSWVLSAALSACGGSSNNAPAASPVTGVAVSGQGSFADGTPIASENVQYQLILDGANMFQTGVNGCTATPAHVAGTVTEDSATSAQGNYSLSVPIQSLHAAVVQACLINSLSVEQVEGLTIKASILANSTTCPVYCSAQGDPSADCVNDCSTGNRTIVATQALTPAQISSQLQNGQGTLQWSGALKFTDLGPALDTGAGPELVVNAADAQSSAHVTQEYFAPGACEVEQSCIRAPGMRTLLRFDGTIENLGDEDLVIGAPANNPLFTNDSCHHVPLLKDIMLYELVDPASGQVVQVNNQVIGRKEGFCMMDISQVNATAAQGKFTCDNQGISAGWEDVYDAALDCQFLDITGVPKGNYNLRLTVNPEGLFQQVSTPDATANIPVTIP
jgi:hypothetical protein